MVEIFVGKQKYAGGKALHRLIPVTQNFTLPMLSCIELHTQCIRRSDILMV